jgi:predicted nucleic acid-binding protein
MSPNIHNIASYSFNKNESFLIDANIWMYIHHPRYSNYFECRTYSIALRRILQSNCNILLDVLVISEFINSWVKYEYNLTNERLKSRNKSITFKYFRRTNRFKRVAKDVADKVRRILKNCQCINSNFGSLNLYSLIDDFERKYLDFNDQILSEICIDKQAKLITHDGDFRDYNIEVLTANNKLLRLSL